MTAIIAGAGIGGLATALFLHKYGVSCTVLEKSPELQELGVGLTLLPHAMAVLDEIGLTETLEQRGVRTEYLIYRTRHGQTVWEETRGLKAGYGLPQISVHRGRLHAALLSTVRDRLGPDAVRLDHRLADFVDTGSRVEARFVSAEDKLHEPITGDVLIGADGIHSVTRQRLIPDEGAARWSGRVLYRGTCEWPVFLDGRTGINSGGGDLKFNVYPIGPGSTGGTRLTNWAMVVRTGADGDAAPTRQDWTLEARRSALMPLLARFTVPEVDLITLVSATDTIWEYPMCDREPLPRWSFGRVTLLGDAAHPMYPFGANGAAQALLDAQSLARNIAAGGAGEAALRLYENDRREAAGRVVAMSRAGGPERVIDAVEAASPQPFADIEAVLPFAEREAIVREYARTAGFARAQ